MRIVVALGGKALLRRGAPASLDTQLQNVARAVASIVPLLQAGHDIIVTHGNGPQAGMLALQAASTLDTPYPLDLLDAGSEGMIGYQFAAGSMRPKVEAACDFTSAAGGRAGIGRLNALAASLAGQAGTAIAVARS